MSHTITLSNTTPFVCAVTVAYNNPEELASLLSSLHDQHACLSGLIIIDNSDNCFSVQNKTICDLYARRYAFIYYHKTTNNVGSAGGFRCGMKIAHKHGFRWVWLLDQDGAVSSNCLAELLKQADKGDILCPNRVDTHRPHSSEPMVFVKNFLGGEYRISWCVTHCQVVTFGTHGVLISKKALDTIGYYDDSLFFVGYEDHDYGYRAVQKGLVILFAAEAEVSHPSSLPTGKKLKIFPAQLNLKILPADLNYVSVRREERPCSRNEARSIAPFSKAYLDSKHLEPWQFAMALVYSECYALYRKIAGERGVALTATLRLHLKCLRFSLKRDWPYRTIELLCQDII